MLFLPLLSLLSLASAVDPKGPESYCVKLNLAASQLPIAIVVIRQWSPLAADRFYQLATSRFFDNSPFFRVIPNFMAQFGIAASPALNKQWNVTFPDDTARATTAPKNLIGTVAFASNGPNSRTTQIIINTNDNPDLDTAKFTPFGTIVYGGANLFAMDNPTPQLADGIDQTKLATLGPAYLTTAAPNAQFVMISSAEMKNVQDCVQTAA